MLPFDFVTRQRDVALDPGCVISKLHWLPRPRLDFIFTAMITGHVRNTLGTVAVVTKVLIFSVYLRNQIPNRILNLCRTFFALVCVDPSLNYVQINR